MGTPRLGASGYINDMLDDFSWILVHWLFKHVQDCQQMSKVSQNVLLPVLSYKIRWYNTIDPTVYQNLSMLSLLSIPSNCTIGQNGTSMVEWYTMVHPTVYHILSMLIPLSILSSCTMGWVGTAWYMPLCTTLSAC